ncbi:DUF4123 domain-containing protein [Chitinimonas sp. PSY-7]|uniref:DUF4123 domain-containing protein n=1 Tax=Chitinimonas sp. PSY-7 TaxID=3459088 RepID=UPI00403FCC3B
MYFAITPLDVEAIAPKLLAAFDAVKASNPASPPHFYALVDCAFDATIVNRAAKAGVAVYAGTDLAELGELSPRIVAMASERSSRETQLRSLLRSCATMPMFSFIASPLSAQALAQGFASMVMANTPDGLALTLRFADTRVLPALLATLTAQQQQTHLAMLSYWWWSDRDGQLQAFQHRNPPAASVTTEVLTLTDAQFAQLVTSGEADALLGQLYEARREMVRFHQPYENHALVEKAIRLVQARGWHSVPAQFRLASVALVIGEGFATVPEVAAAIKDATSADDLITRIDNLPAHVWQ